MPRRSALQRVLHVPRRRVLQAELRQRVRLQYGDHDGGGLAFDGDESGGRSKDQIYKAMDSEESDYKPDKELKHILNHIDNCRQIISAEMVIDLAQMYARLPTLLGLQSLWT